MFFKGLGLKKGALVHRSPYSFCIKQAIPQGTDIRSSPAD